MKRYGLMTAGMLIWLGFGTAAAQDSSVPLPKGSDIVTPPAPPVLAPALSSPTPTPRLPLGVPTDPLDVRIRAVQKLSLPRAFELALKQNPLIRQAQLDIASAQAGVDQARAAYSFTGNSSANYTYTQRLNTNNIPAPLFQQDSSQLNASLLQLNYTFLDGGLRDSRLQAAQQQLKVAQLTLDQVQQQTKLDVAETYYTLQQADTQVAIRQATIRSSQANLENAQAALQAGFGTRFDVLRTETELANNQQDLLQVQNQQRQTRRRLTELLAFELPDDVTATDPIQPAGSWDLSVEATVVKAFAQRQELEILRQQVGIAQAQAQVALSANRPQVTATASLQTAKDLQQENAFDVSYQAGINVSLNWWDGGSAAAQARQQDIAGQRSTSQFDQTLYQIRRFVEETFLALNTNRTRIEAAKVTVGKAEEGLELAQLRFKAGIATQTEVISAEVALTQARVNLSDAILGYNRSLAQLKRAISNL